MFILLTAKRIFSFQKIILCFMIKANLTRILNLGMRFCLCLFQIIPKGYFSEMQAMAI